MKYVPRRSNGAFFGTVLGLLVFGLCFWGIGYSLGEDESVLKFLLYFPVLLKHIAKIFPAVFS
jgi:hypothetical protein